jgi:lambda family phage portal protein
VPEAYFILKRHPGETVTAVGRADDFEEVPAFFPNGCRKVMHLFDPMRPEQHRGFSEFAAGLKDYMNLDRYHEAEIFAALEDACLTGFVMSKRPDEWQANRTVGGLDDEEGHERTEPRIHEFAPNQWHYLEPGEEVDIHSPKRPNDAFAELTGQLLRGPANSLDIPPEVLSQNWQNMNYSNARTVLLQLYLVCRVRQTYLVENYCSPTHENVALSAVAHGKVDSTGFDRRREDFLSHAWIPPGWPWVDPEREANGKETELANNTDTLTDICASKGVDVDDHLETRARELKRMKELELKYEITFPTSQGGKKESGKSRTEEGGEEKSILSVVK